ncbi:MAG: AAA family ATPase [Bacteroidota bacterium]
MRINKVHLKNFKRFTDLTLDNIPADAKLVLLIGANGSGKSSVFDGLSNFKSISPNPTYYRKAEEGDCFVKVTIDNYNEIAMEYLPDGGISYGHIPAAIKFISRTSIRIIPRITNKANPDAIKDDLDRPETFIDNDNRLQNDVFAYMHRIDDALRAPVFKGESADTVKIFRDLIQPFNESLLKIFGENVQTTIQIVKYQNATPYAPPQLIFKKGDVEINYDLLSHGEKQIVILLLNFIVRREQYNDAIIFIDEMDCHLNTALQSRLLEEIVTKWIPNSSQLWTASHALGFIDYARNSAEAVILDFDNLDFDISQVIEPERKDNVEVYEIAIPKAMLFDIIDGKRFVLCENQNDEYYNLMQLPNIIFVGVKDARDLFLKVKTDKRFLSLRDRDFLSDDEIAEIRGAYPNHFILNYYNFENYLYHPDNIAELQIDGFDVAAYRKEITQQKNDRKDYILPALVSSRQSYEEFKTIKKLDAKETTSIVDDFRSDDFERFYKYFDMKKHFTKTIILAPFNIDKKRLVTTQWFRDSISQILS